VPTILIVDDDPDIRELERAALTHAGHKVVMASNGREALGTLERMRPCLILLDLMMPVMDGLTFLVEMRRIGAANVPVLCVSAAGDGVLARALQLGARECLPKPADVEELCSRVLRYCS
jgi:DNA-binding response OmpR family regulator